MKVNKEEMLLAMAEAAFGNRELQASTGLSLNAISRARNGQSCSLKTVHKLAKALDVPVRRLVSGEARNE